MHTITELREKRTKAWNKAKAFLDAHRDDSGVLPADQAEAYDHLEQEVVNLGREIERMERQEAIDREMNAATSTPITTKPTTPKVDTKTGRAADAYKDSFWKQMRNKTSMEVRNVLSVGVDTEGGFLVSQ